MFTMSKFWERIFYLGTFVAQGSSYLSPYVYGILHRQHHAYADTEKDPHSPKYDKNVFKMMWRTKELYSGILHDTIKVSDNFKQHLPYWKRMEYIADHWGIRIAWAVAYIAFYAAFSPSPWFYLLLPAHFIMGPLHGAVINWCAHKYGYRNFEVNDTSRNLLPVDFLMLGESYHNNHHKAGSRPNFGVRWFEVDPVYISIWIFDKLGIIKLNKESEPVRISSK